MGSFTITVPRLERPITEILSRMPKSFREQAQKGFVVLAGVNPQHYGAILKAVLVGLESKKAPLEELEKTLRLPPNDLNGLFAAAMLTVPLIAEGVDVGEFAAGATKHGLIPADVAPKVQPFFDAIWAQRAEVGQSIRRTALPAQVLPYITNVEVVVDLRIAFERDVVQEGIPVAMLHIDTDVQGQEIWFQASKSQLMQLRDDIDGAVKKMEIADAWGRKDRA